MEQKAANEARMNKLNKEEIKEECWELFKEQEKAKEDKWDRKGKKYLVNRAL
jgi:hypothetical protein